MRIKTIIIVLITVLFTIVLMQNTGKVNFQILWATFWMSKLVMLLLVAIVAFIIGVLVGRPKKIKRLGGDFTDSNTDTPNSSTLSDEDKEYIN
ncbi:hypothetical protein [Mucilaginibacter sp.]|uniref:hypothetical protein n=1 Tax=Mucilaginibacter sp. TaxID=1882438 RepID=UPI003D0C9D92